MKHNTLQLIKKLLDYYFIDKSQDKILDLLCDDVYICGLPYNEIVTDKEQIKEFLQCRESNEFMNDTYVAEREDVISDEMAVLCFTILNRDVEIQCRVSGTSKVFDGVEKLNTLHFSLISPKNHPGILAKMANNKSEISDFENLVDNVNGGIAVYRVEEDGHMSLVSASDGVYRLAGRTKEEYEKLCEENAIFSVFIEDRKRIKDAISDTVNRDVTTQLPYRFKDKEGKFNWINGIFTKIGKDNGRPIVRAIYTTASPQYDLQLQTLHTEGIGIYVVDKETKQLYFANEASFRLYDVPQCDITGKYCYEVFHNRNMQCDDCDRNSLEKTTNKSVKISGGKVLSISREERIWNNRRVCIAYVRDITSDSQIRESLIRTRKAVNIAMKYGQLDLWIYDIDNGEIIHELSGKDSVEETKTEVTNLDKYIESGEIYIQDLQNYRDFYQRIADGADESECVIRIYHDDVQEYRWVKMYLTRQKKTAASHSKAIGFLVDIHEEHESNERFEKLLSNVDAGIAIFKTIKGNNLKIEYISQGLCRMGGFDNSAQLHEDLKKGNTIGMFPKYQKDVKDAFARVCSNYPEPVQVTYKANVPNQGEKWIVMRLKAVKENNEEFSIYGVFNDVTELINAQNEVKRIQAATQAACEFAGMWLWIYDMENDCIMASDNLQRDYGIPKRLDNFPQSWFDMGFVSPEYIEMHRERVQAIKDGSLEEEFECKMIHRDGTQHWSRIRFNRLENTPGFAVGTAQLIDDEKILSARLELEKKKTIGRDNNLLSHVITNVTKDKVIEMNAVKENAPVTKLGITLKEAMDLAKSDIYEKDLDRYVMLHDRNQLIKAYHDGVLSNEYIGRRLAKNGDAEWVRDVFNLLKDPGTGDIYLYEYLYDINSDKIAKEVMDAAVRNDYEGIASVNLSNGRMTEISSGQINCKIETSSWDFQSRTVLYGEEYVYKDDLDAYLKNIAIDNVRKQLSLSNIYEFVFRAIDNDGRIRHKRIRFSYYDHEAEICLVTRADITVVIVKEEEDKRQLEEALRLAEEATKTKSQFLSRMSHEIRTPMNAIMGMTAIAQENKSDFIQVSECLSKIDLSAHYLLTLLNDILEMSRIESGSMTISREEFDVSVLLEGIRTIVETLAVQNDIRYECINKITTGFNYKGDMIRIQQVLVNILTNAVKFTKSGGRVRFTIESENISDNKVLFHFTIADTGIGMSEEFMKKMFDPFVQADGSYTSKYQGSGLGLAISKNLVNIMGGKVTAESYEGIGSTFYIDIPLEQMSRSDRYTSEHTPDTCELKEEDLNGTKILVAENHPMNVMIVKKLLENKGVNVSVANNGKMAAEIFSNSKCGYYDAILMDMRMPVMDGLEATRLIREMNREDAGTIPIIAMTANALDEDRQRTREAGMNAHLAKPFEPKELYTVLLSYIRK